MDRFKEGDKVLNISDGFRAYKVIAHVFKVYKNGNFILRKGGQQFKPCGVATGHKYHPPYCIPYNEKVYSEHRERLRKTKKRRLAKDGIEQVSSEQDLDEILRIIALYD